MNERESAALLKTAQAWRDGGRRVAVATVIKTWGSAPRPVGARLVAADDGAFAGSVSGGCVEGAVMESALQAMREDAPQILRFGVADETAWEVGLSCGGEMEILTEPFHGRRAERMAALRRAIESRRPRALLTRIPDGAQRLLSPDENEFDKNESDGNESDGADGASNFPDEVAESARALLREGGEARTLESGGSRYFVEPFHPPRRLILSGGTHIAQALIPLARAAEFDPIVADPRGAWASPGRFPDCEILNQWPDDALRKLGTDSGTALAALTHDPKLDDPALVFALRAETPPRYIGALGGRRTHEKRLSRLRDEFGIPDALLTRIRAPIGLAIGARTAAEMALSIAAEIVAAFRLPQK